MELSEAAKVFKALSCEQRLKLYKLLVEWEGFEEVEECCGVMKAFTRASDLMKISKSTISHHMKELVNAGLIVCTKNGQSVTCSINRELSERIKEML